MYEEMDRFKGQSNLEDNATYGINTYFAFRVWSGEYSILRTIVFRDSFPPSFLLFNNLMVSNYLGNSITILGTGDQ